MKEAAIKENVLHLLDAEIKHVISSEKDSGVTVWALTVALASILWVILDQIEALQVELSNILLLFLLYSLITDFIYIFSRGIASTSTFQGERRFRFSQQDLSSSRSAALLLFIRALVLVLLISQYGDYLFSITKYTTYIFYFFLLFLILVGLILSFINLPLPITREQSFKKTAVLLVISLIPLMCAIDILYPWDNNHILSFSISDYKLSSLILAFSILLIILVRSRIRTPLLDSLIRLRRDIALSKLDIDDAVKQVDIALIGLRVTDVFQKELKLFLDLTEKISFELDVAVEKITALRRQLPEDPSQMTGDQSLICKSVFITAVEHMKKSNRLIEDYDKSITKYIKKVSFMRLKPSEQEIVTTQIKEMLTKIRQKNDGVLKTQDEFENKYCIACKLKCD